jgi:nucleotide-binding universal stress UspA family protein
MSGVLICYDGSADARAAVEQAAKLFSNEPATVLTVWEPYVDLVVRSSFGFVPSIPDADEVDEASRKAAETRAAEGAGLATGFGMAAIPKAASHSTTTARAILAEADGMDATAIVMGSRGLTGVKSLLLGSVSHELIQHADRTVVVAPSREVAGSRARALHDEDSR